MKTVNTISAADLKKMLAEDACSIIDIRDQDEHRSGAIQGSVNIPMSKLSQEGIKNLEHDVIVVHCLSGMRSAKACENLKHIEGKTIYQLEGGLKAWKTINGDVVRQTTRFTLMQQVQIIAGGAVLAGALLSLLVHPNWVYLSAFFGAGLLFAGLSGWCGMARLLAKMPWNKGA